VYYPVAFEDRDLNARSNRDIIKNSIENNVYVFNAIRWGLHVYKAKQQDGQPLVNIPKSPTYEDFSADDLQMMLFALNGITELAGDRNVYIFTIPIDRDANAMAKQGYEFTLVDSLTELAAAQDNVVYVDLLPPLVDYMTKNNVDFSTFTLGCNTHWGLTGNQVVADIVYEAVYRQQPTALITD